MGETILVTSEDRFLEITLNRPERLNSFNDEMHLALRAALEKAGKSAARAILLTGAGRAFCSGQDLNARAPETLDGPPDLGQTLITFYNPLIRQIRRLDIPVVCAVNGVAAGAGSSIALACDIVLAAESARFIQSFAKVGLIPDAGGTWSLTRLVGEARAKALALTTEPLTASKAAEWGLIWKAVPDERLLGEARSLVRQLADGPTISLGMTKKAIQAAQTNSMDAQLDLEAEYQKICGMIPDYAEGVSAFLNKRAPRFRGSGA